MYARGDWYLCIILAKKKISILALESNSGDPECTDYVTVAFIYSVIP